MSFAIGIHGVPLPTVSRVQPRHLERVRAAGAEVVGLYVNEAERTDPRRWAPRLAERLAAAGLPCVHLVGPSAPLLAHDGDRRRAAVASVARSVEAVVALGADRLFVGPGGFSEKGPWWYHPLNFAPESRRSLARSLRELGAIAEAAGIGVVVEGHQTSVLESPAVFREVLEEAGSAAVRANLDYVNYLRPAAVARFEAAVREMADALGPRLASVHVKDVVVWPRLAVHIEEAPAGRGVLDLGVVVSVAHSFGVPALAEHLHAKDADAALSHLAALVARVANAASQAMPGRGAV